MAWHLYTTAIIVPDEPVLTDVQGNEKLQRCFYVVVDPCVFPRQVAGSADQVRPMSAPHNLDTLLTSNCLSGHYHVRIPLDCYTHVRYVPVLRLRKEWVTASSRYCSTISVRIQYILSYGSTGGMSAFAKPMRLHAASTHNLLPSKLCRFKLLMRP